ncbi:MAG: hypothetical protein JSU68_09655 [Phycisphaerales bacterium]|nr:MAG: hypothetical protein JSU68_09655 [Phycisphaerales bacterium]
MTRTKLLAAIVAPAICCWPAATQADISIIIVPASQQVGLGESVTVDLIISGLTDYGAPSLGVFDLDLAFDPSILSLDSVVFGDPLLGDQLDLSGFGSITMFDDSAPGVLNLFELSLDPAAILDTLQAGSFNLLSLTFNPLGIGASLLGLSLNALGDSLGSPLAATLGGASIAVVPAPAAVALGAAGLLCLLGSRFVPRRGNK